MAHSNLHGFNHRAFCDTIQKSPAERGMLVRPPIESARKRGARIAADMISQAVLDAQPPVNSRILAEFAQRPGVGMTIDDVHSMVRCAASAVPKRMSELRKALKPMGLTILKRMVHNRFGDLVAMYHLLTIESA